MKDFVICWIERKREREGDRGSELLVTSQGGRGRRLMVRVMGWDFFTIIINFTWFFLSFSLFPFTFLSKNLSTLVVRQPNLWRSYSNILVCGKFRNFLRRYTSSLSMVKKLSIWVVFVYLEPRWVWFHSTQPFFFIPVFMFYDFILYYTSFIPILNHIPAFRMA